MQKNSAAPAAEEGALVKVNTRNAVKEIAMEVLFIVAAIVFVAAVLVICVYQIGRAHV